MEDGKLMYRMSTLMNYTDFDAFTAQKEAGSKNAYFELLDDFVANAPTMSAGLHPPKEPEDLPDYFERIGKLQNQLLLIGSTALMWEAEHAAELARTGDTNGCATEASLLASKVNALRDKIAEARVEDWSAEKPQSPAAPAHAPAVAAADSLPVSPVRVTPFEKLALLIDNFELDDAMQMLNTLMGFSYNKVLDAALRSIHIHLANYDYNAASDAVRKVLKIVEIIESHTEGTQKKKILAIDDVPDVLSTVKAVLKDRYSVYGVTNHMAALKFVTTNSADLILLDIEMPDMNGFALLGIIRRIKAYKRTPVLFLTGSVSVANVKKSLDAGGNDFIKKPVDSQILLSRVEKHLGC